MHVCMTNLRKGVLMMKIMNTKTNNTLKQSKNEKGDTF